MDPIPYQIIMHGVSLFLACIRDCLTITVEPVLRDHHDQMLFGRVFDLPCARFTIILNTWEWVWDGCVGAGGSFRQINLAGIELEKGFTSVLDSAIGG